MTTIITFGFDVTLEVTPLECLGLNGYFWQMVFWMLLPLGLVALVFAGAAVWLGFRRGMSSLSLAGWLSTATPLSIRILFLAYPIVTRQAFQAFSWFDFHEENVSYLRADVSLVHDTPEYAAAQAVALIAIIVYPIGLLLIFGALLFCARRSINSGKPTQLSKAISFLYCEYETGFYWWELVEMARRFLLVGFFVVKPGQGTVEQLAYGTLVSIVYLALQMSASPFKRASDDFLANVCSLLIAVLYICAIFFKFGALTDVGDLQRVMSTEQRGDYRPPFATLTLVLGSTSIGAVAILGIIIAVQAANEALQARIAARAAMARRLRYFDTEEEAEPAPPANWPKWLTPKHECPPNQIGPFHILLSHNWAQGQDQMRIVKARLREMMPNVSVFLDVDALGNTIFKDFEHVDMSNAVLVFLTKGFMRSGPCAKELVRAILLKKPIIAVLESDPHRGGLTQNEVSEMISAVQADGETTWLTEAKYRAGAPWWIKDVVQVWSREWGGPELKVPAPHEVIEALFGFSPPIVWYALADLQDVSMRLIAERLLPPSTSQLPKILSASSSMRSGGSSAKQLKNASSSRVRVHDQVEDAECYTQADESGAAAMPSSPRLPDESPASKPSAVVRASYVQGEIAQQILKSPIKLETLASGRTHHLYVSVYNAGASDLASELQEVTKCGIRWTSDKSQLGQCDRMLVHLHAKTWNSGEAGDTFACEVATAMRLGVQMLLLHEVLSGRDDDNAKRHACTFMSLIEGTPKHLIAAKFYETMIALNLAGDEWRQTGLIRAVQRIAEGSGLREPRVVAEAEEERAELHGRAIAAAPCAAVASGATRVIELAGTSAKVAPFQHEM